MKPRPWSVLAALIVGVASFAAGYYGPGSATLSMFSDTAESTGNVISANATFADFCDTPGPDLFGYTCKLVSHRFEDINATGIHVPLQDNQLTGGIGLGFQFRFYDQVRNFVRISSNGYITWGTGSSGCCGGQNLPNVTSPNDLVAGYWQNLNPGAYGWVKYQTKTDANGTRFIVQFTDVPHFPNTTRVTFQFVLMKTSNDIYINYRNVAPAGPGAHAAGIENRTGMDGLRLRFGNWTFTNTSVLFNSPVTGPFPPLDGKVDPRVDEQGRGWLDPDTPFMEDVAPSPEPEASSGEAPAVAAPEAAQPEEEAAGRQRPPEDSPLDCGPC